MASAIRHIAKEKMPNRIVRTIRKAPVLPLKHVFPRLGSRSACVTAILCSIVWVQERHNSFKQEKQKRKWIFMFCRE